MTVGDVNGFFQVVQKLHSGFFVSHAWLYSQNGGKYVVYNITMLVPVRERVCRVFLEFGVCLEREYDDFSIIAGDSKRSLFQQLEMSYYCISKPYYN